MESSILKTIRRSITGSSENTFFDEDLIMAANVGFLTLTQLGVGPEEGFIVEDEKTKWEDFTDDELLLTTVNTYICRRTRLEFDPPTGSVLEALKASIDQMEWRLRHAVEIQMGKL